MAHLIDTSNGRDNMAYVGETPWHGLGRLLTPDAPLDTWIEEAGFDWEIKRSPVMFQPKPLLEDLNTPLVQMPDRWVLSRSDTLAPLSVVSSNYRMTQPRVVAEFFRDLVTAGGFKMETMGMLKGGAVYWALARADDSFTLGKDDTILPYLLVATSADGSLANVASFTSVRVVCNNTLTIAVGGRGKGYGESNALRIPHSTDFKPEEVKKQLGLIAPSWDKFKSDITDLSKVMVSREDALSYFMNVLYPGKTDFDLKAKRPALELIINTLDNGVGQSTSTAKGTAWGLVNAITRFTDFEKTSKSNDNRLTAAWFGSGALLKKRAWEEALKLAA